MSPRMRGGGATAHEDRLRQATDRALSAATTAPLKVRAVLGLLEDLRPLREYEGQERCPAAQQTVREAHAVLLAFRDFKQGDPLKGIAPRQRDRSPRVSFSAGGSTQFGSSAISTRDSHIRSHILANGSG